VDAERQIVALMRPDRAERLAVRTVVDVLRTQAARVQQAHTPASAPTAPLPLAKAGESSV
jgi:hypothetical protein